ncbi:mannonate dehydratase [Lentibacillus populi]|uniref:mannonate dehydratase n=1 Tax=Lentibacillus populi TaxID=1827502 RepID=A0A9W5TWD6_9BACI|nr:mannonate dehydratase [Lentibacillus populi]GGB38984.1 mannonate dehydratase [Lentibacillus populi]
MDVSITVNHTDLSEVDLKQLSQLGVDYVDFGNGDSFKGVKEQGYPDLDELIKLRNRLREWGLDINRVTLPNITSEYMENKEGGEREIQNSLNAIKVFSEAGVSIVRQRFAGDTFPNVTRDYRAPQRGGAYSRGESLNFNKQPMDIRTLEEHEIWWERFSAAYKQLVLLAQDCNVKMAMHPSDTPLPDTPFGGLGYHRIIDQFPQKNVGYVYCVGTRAEAGGTPLVLDEINHYGRKNRIFLVHFRNVKGSLPTAGAFEEALLDDGDMNMFKILLELRKVGYEGCLNPDHVPLMEGDKPNLNKNWANSNIGWTHSSIGFAYSVGYIKALLAALVEFEGR